MVAEAITGLTIFKSMMDTARGLKDIHDATIRDQVAFTLQRQILEAQTAQMALVDDVGNLKAQIAQFETWDAEKQRYELVAVRDGALAYQIKGTMQGGEPDHYICANCYERRTKSFLQGETWNPGRAHILSCHTCGSAIYLDGMPQPEHAKYRHRSA